MKTAVDTLMVAKSDLLSGLEAIPASEIHISLNTTDSGEIVENRPVRMLLPIPIDCKDVVAGNLTPIIETINAAAEEGVTTIEAQLFDYMHRVTEAFGTRVNGVGDPFGHPAIRKLVENSEIDFDADGTPNLESWVFRTYNPTRLISLDEMMRLLPSRTPEEMQRWNEMIERKRIEFNAKRRHRTLS